MIDRITEAIQERFQTAGQIRRFLGEDAPQDLLEVLHALQSDGELKMVEQSKGGMSAYFLPGTPVTKWWLDGTGRIEYSDEQSAVSAPSRPAPVPFAEPNSFRAKHFPKPFTAKDAAPPIAQKAGKEKTMGKTIQWSDEMFYQAGLQGLSKGAMLTIYGIGSYATLDYQLAKPNHKEAFELGKRMANLGMLASGEDRLSVGPSLEEARLIEESYAHAPQDLLAEIVEETVEPVLEETPKETPEETPKDPVEEELAEEFPDEELVEFLQDHDEALNLHITKLSCGGAIAVMINCNPLALSRDEFDYVADLRNALNALTGIEVLNHNCTKLTGFCGSCSAKFTVTVSSRRPWETSHPKHECPCTMEHKPGSSIFDTYKDYLTEELGWPPRQEEQ